MKIKENVVEVLVTQIKFLLFMRVKPDLNRLGNFYLGLGILTAWLAGMGRYWDNPKAEWWQYFGVGSLVYIFILALILWLIIKPLRPQNWSYKGVLTFVGLTSLPAILYAIPVERYFTLNIASMMNVWFLVTVATWRVILLFVYLKRVAKLSAFVIIVAALLPLVIIVTALTLLNLEHVVFKIMAGLTDAEVSANDDAYSVLLAITFSSVIASPVLLLAYIGIIYFQRKKVKCENAD